MPAPTGGMNTDAHPWELPENEAPVLDNFLIQPGKIVMRNPFYGVGALPQINGTTRQSPVGAMLIDSATTPEGLMLVSALSPANAVRCVDPWNAPLVHAASANLAAAANKIAQFNLTNGTSTLSAAVATQDQVPGPRSINFNGLIYGISYDSSGAVVTDANSNYHMKPLSLYTMPAIQTPGTVTLPTVLSNAPHGAFDLIGYQSRIWLLGGVDTPGALTVHEPTTLYFTIPGASGIGTASNDWKDPVALTTNKITMDGDFDDFGVGLAVVRNGLLILRRSSVWLLRGTTTANYTLIPISTEVGCVDARSIVETDHGVFFMSHRGLMLTNGTTVANVSANVSRQLRAAIQEEQNQIQASGYSAGGNSGWVSCGLTSQGQIMVSIGFTALVGLVCSMTPRWTGMYDPELKVWTKHTSAIWYRESGSTTKLPPPFVGRKSRGQLYTVGDQEVVELENAARVTSIIGTQSTSFLVRENFSTENVFFDYTSTTTDPIPAIWRTRLIPVNVSKRKMSIPLRYFMDSVFAWNATGTAALFGGWRTSPLGTGQTVGGNSQSFGVALQTAIQWPLAGFVPDDPGRENRSTPLIQRHNSDWFSELEDMYFEIDWPGDSIANGLYATGGFAEIYGIGMEYQGTSPVR